MKLSIGKNELYKYVLKQLESFFPDGKLLGGVDLQISFDLALDRLEYCYQHIRNPLYREGKQTLFNHLHGDQYCQFLYYFANSLWNLSYNKICCEKLMQLSRALSGCFWSFNSGLPDIFYLSHPVGAVLGKAKYSNFFVARQNCTVATQINDNVKPFGEYLYLGAGASITTAHIEIGDYVAIGTGITVYQATRIPSNSLVVCDNKENKFLKRDREWYQRVVFKDIFDCRY